MFKFTDLCNNNNAQILRNLALCCWTTTENTLWISFVYIFSILQCTIRTSPIFPWDSLSSTASSGGLSRFFHGIAFHQRRPQVDWAGFSNGTYHGWKLWDVSKRHMRLTPELKFCDISGSSLGPFNSLVLACLVLSCYKALELRNSISYIYSFSIARLLPIYLIIYVSMSYILLVHSLECTKCMYL